MEKYIRYFWCWLTIGHIWERVGGIEPAESVWNEMPGDQMYMCVYCVKCVRIDVENWRRIA